ncbi:MAG TPA: hypothetical protein VF742_05415, partial [Terracidiphilus sp.]
TTKSAGSKTAAGKGQLRTGSNRSSSAAKPASAVRRGGLSRTAAGAGARRKPALAGSGFGSKHGTKKRG